MSSFDVVFDFVLIKLILFWGFVLMRMIRDRKKKTRLLILVDRIFLKCAAILPLQLLARKLIDGIWYLNLENKRCKFNDSMCSIKKMKEWKSVKLKYILV